MIFKTTLAALFFLSTQCYSAPVCPPNQDSCMATYNDFKACLYFQDKTFKKGVSQGVQPIGGSKYLQCAYSGQTGNNFLIYGTTCDASFDCLSYCSFNTFTSNGLSCKWLLNLALLPAEGLKLALDAIDTVRIEEMATPRQD